ncbi:FG-GAP repeat protein, partial [bacterium]|nr:FG-GAP repeat protein [candidate division CSSED10-310 bacterium]
MERRAVKAMWGLCAVIIWIGLAGSVFGFNGDTYSDLAVGVPFEDYAGITDAGIVNLFYSDMTGLTTDGNQYFSQDSDGIEDTCETDDQFGLTLESGDFNGDGFADLAIGIPREDVGSAGDAGAVHIIYGSAGGLANVIPSWFLTMDILDVEAVSQPYDFFGAGLAAGDFNGDGFDDLAIGSPNKEVSTFECAGVVFVVNGSPTGLDPMEASAWSQDTPNIDGAAEPDDTFGQALAAGDINGDGFIDLVVGVPGEAIGWVSHAGCFHVIYGSGTGLTSSGTQIIWQGMDGLYAGT